MPKLRTYRDHRFYNVISPNVLPRDPICLSGVCCRCVSVCPSVCLSVTGRFCVETTSRIELFLAWELPWIYPKLCYKKIRYLQK